MKPKIKEKRYYSEYNRIGDQSNTDAATATAGMTTFAATVAVVEEENEQEEEYANTQIAAITATACYDPPTKARASSTAASASTVPLAVVRQNLNLIRPQAMRPHEQVAAAAASAATATAVAVQPRHNNWQLLRHLEEEHDPRHTNSRRQIQEQEPFLSGSVPVQVPVSVLPKKGRDQQQQQVDVQQQQQRMIPLDAVEQFYQMIYESGYHQSSIQPILQETNQWHQKWTLQDTSQHLYDYSTTTTSNNKDDWQNVDAGAGDTTTLMIGGGGAGGVDVDLDRVAGAKNPSPPQEQQLHPQQIVSRPRQQQPQRQQNQQHLQSSTHTNTIPSYVMLYSSNNKKQQSEHVHTRDIGTGTIGIPNHPQQNKKGGAGGVEEQVLEDSHKRLRHNHQQQQHHQQGEQVKARKDRKEIDIVEESLVLLHNTINHSTKMRLTQNTMKAATRTTTAITTRTTSTTAAATTTQLVRPKPLRITRPPTLSHNHHHQHEQLHNLVITKPTPVAPTYNDFAATTTAEPMVINESTNHSNSSIVVDTIPHQPPPCHIVHITPCNPRNVNATIINRTTNITSNGPVSEMIWGNNTNYTISPLTLMSSQASSMSTTSGHDQHGCGNNNNDHRHNTDNVHFIHPFDGDDDDNDINKDDPSCSIVSGPRYLFEQHCKQTIRDIFLYELVSAGGDVQQLLVKPTTTTASSSSKLSSLSMTRFQSAFSMLHQYFLDSQMNVSLDESNETEGLWITLTKPTFFAHLGQNDSGDPMYSMGRMSFDMFSPTSLICSLQGNFNEIERVSSEHQCKILDKVPKALQDEVSCGTSVLRTYNIMTAFTIEPPVAAYPNAPNQQVRTPIRGIMTTYGYTLADPKERNRHSVWITGGRIQPNDDHHNIQEWMRLFTLHPPKHGIGEQARLLAVKWLMGAVLPTDMDADDGSMEYSFHRPLGGHGRAFVDTLYVDESLRIVRGHRGTIFVFSRVKPTTQVTETT